MFIADFDPIIFNIGGFAPRWYGLGYAVAILVSLQLLNVLTAQKYSPIKKDDNITFLFIMFSSMIVFARLIYVLFYNLPFYLNAPSRIIRFWEGGLSYHGALIGLFIGLVIFAKLYKHQVNQLLDVGVVAMSQSVFWGRIGNFINGELYGRVTDLPWGVIFPKGGDIPRHPSQLYEGIFEGIIIFVILWKLKSKKLATGSLFAIYLMLYGVFRFLIEFVREPDGQLGYIGGFITMGQILCSVMIVIGLLLFARFRLIKV